ncbi:MAG: hypothetical protein HUJ90_01680, partial [Bacteroidales bacterium]|nr:hypothetical protein [Bacteroidales bacterium]
RNTALAKLHYSLLHKESPDPRGIDVAMIYDAKKVTLLKHEFIEIPDFATRDILYASVILKDSDAPVCDTIHLFVNHWPSKRSSDKSDKRRFAVARTLVQHIDAIRLNYGKNAKILLMGDFNDTPESAVITELCRVASLVNLSLPLASTGIGSLKYNGKWELIDQFIVSEKMKELVAEAMIFQADFLMEKDKKYLGIKPKRTNIGPRYNGGASDHLPILLKFLPALPEDR